MLLAGLGANLAHGASTAPDADARLRACRSFVEGLHADKPGQARVYAADGSEFTAGQAQWMRAQLRLANQAQAAGHSDEAARVVAQVQQLIDEHHRA